MQLDWLSHPEHLAALRLVDTNDGLNHGRLACAVLAKQQMDLSLLNGQVDVVQCYNAGEYFRDFAHFQQRHLGIAVCWPPVLCHLHSSLLFSSLPMLCCLCIVF